MKIWLNKLKPGDTFYDNDLFGVHYYKVIGDARNPNFKMSRFKVTDLDTNTETELFVNHYVYDNYDECKRDLLESLNAKLKDTNENLLTVQKACESLKHLIQRIKNEQEDNK